MQIENRSSFFVSFRNQILELLDPIVNQQELHGLWINTLSYLENCGARKIASCEHPTQVKEEMLKHASEESRHAFHLKKQLSRIGVFYKDYCLSSLMGGWSAHRYLNALDIKISRYLRSLKMDGSQTKQLAYLLVTYAIELRADELYPLYQSVLRKAKSKVQVQSILLEEKEHLQEMESELSQLPRSIEYIRVVCQIEADLFQKWLEKCSQEVLYKVG